MMCTPLPVKYIEICQGCSEVSHSPPPIPSMPLPPFPHLLMAPACSLKAMPPMHSMDLTLGSPAPSKEDVKALITSYV